MTAHNGHSWCYNQIPFTGSAPVPQLLLMLAATGLYLPSLENQPSVKQELSCLRYYAPLSTFCSLPSAASEGLTRGQRKPVLGPHNRANSMTQVMLQISQENKAETHLQLTACSGLALSPAPFWFPHSLLHKSHASQPLYQTLLVGNLSKATCLFFLFSLFHFWEGQL